MSDLSSRSTGDFDPHPVPGGPAGEPALMSDAALQLMHERLLAEKESPTEGFSLMPIVLIFLFAGLIFWSGLYIINECGRFNSFVYDDSWRPGQQGAAEEVDMMKLGERTFMAQCKQCHGADGKGQPGTYPPLAGSPWPVGNPARPIRIVLAGMGGPITVEGATYSAQQMPSVGATLKDQQIAAVLTYIRASFGNNAPPVDTADVTAARADIGKRGPWTPDEILAHFPLDEPKPVGAAAPKAASPATPAPAAGAPAAAPAP